MAELRETAGAWLAEGRGAVIVEVSAARGSVPRETGTRMLVSATQCAGTIGGGHLEWKAIAKARAMLSARDAAVQVEHYPLGPALGQCCGGAVTLTYSNLDASAIAAWPRGAPLFELQLYGAGHVGRAIVRALAPLPVRVAWIDEREDEFDAARDLLAAPGRAQVQHICVDTLEAEVLQAPPGAFYLVLTHQHDLDLRIVEAILRRGDFAYLGLIGSKTKRARFVHRFEERGIAPELLTRLTCPIGVAGIEGKEPVVIAAAVVAQLLQQAEARRPITRSFDRP
jgi:xanthine dehydrogenase accessory factor